MKGYADDSRIWIECAVLTGFSALLTMLLNIRFARSRPAEPLPNHQSGDTPAMPWEGPNKEEKAKAEPVRQALDQATAQVTSPEKANRVAERLEKLAGSATSGDVEQASAPQKTGNASDKLAESSQRIEQAAQSASPVEKAADGIAQAAKEIATSPKREQEALADATQEALNPDQQGSPGAGHPKQREYLRLAVFKRMKPLDALDAKVFLAINHLPHNRWLNGFFRFFTIAFSAGIGWYIVMAIAILCDHRKGIRAFRRVILPLSITSSLVEYPIKAFFRRRRPFIDVIQAIVIGKKPGSWSFPSGHSATAFAGAWLLSREFPRRRPLFFILAGLVAFSRIYLGDHYPGDVVSGTLSGMGLAETLRWVEQSGVHAAGRNIGT
jgi:undecaprenyl-diphosphatase